MLSAFAQQQSSLGNCLMLPMVPQRVAGTRMASGAQLVVVGAGSLTPGRKPAQKLSMPGIPITGFHCNAQVLDRTVNA